MKTGLVTRRRRMSSDWTSGMPAFSSVASSWLKTRNSRVGIRARLGSASGAQPPSAAGPVDAEDEQSLFLELAPQPRLALGDVDAFDDLPARRPEPAAKFHALVTRLGVRAVHGSRKLLSVRTLSADYRRIIYPARAEPAHDALLVRQTKRSDGWEMRTAATRLDVT